MGTTINLQLKSMPISMFKKNVLRYIKRTKNSQSIYLQRAIHSGCDLRIRKSPQT